MSDNREAYRAQGWVLVPKSNVTGSRILIEGMGQGLHLRQDIGCSREWHMILNRPCFHNLFLGMKW